MTSEGKKTTTTVTFQLEDEDFQVKLETTSENGKVVSVSDSTQKFFDYLKSLHLVSNTEDICTWLNNSENLTISIFPISNSKYSPFTTIFLIIPFKLLYKYSPYNSLLFAFSLKTIGSPTL